MERINIALLLFSYSVVYDSLQPHGPQHTRLPCPSLSPGVCLNSCPLNLCCPPSISSSVAPFSPSSLLPSSFPNIKVCSNELALGITWLKYQSFSFSISPSSEYSVRGGLEVRVKRPGQIQSHPEHPGAPLWLFLSPPSAFSSLSSASRLFCLHVTFSCHGPDSSSPHHSSLNFTLNSFVLCLS